MQASLFRPRARAIRRLVMIVAGAGVLLALCLRGLGDYESGFPPLGSTDFVQYWSAARLLVGGGNPYDPATLFSMEQSVGWPQPEPLLMWNPPYVLALVLPVAYLPFNLATLAWLSLQFGLILGSGVLLWRYFAPDDGRYWIGLLAGLAFVPALFSLRLGQISPWLLVGVVGFLWAEHSRRDFLAGSALALLMIKPQVTYLFLLAALWWAWRDRRWRVLAGGLGAMLAASGLVFLVSPGIVANYLAAAARPPLYWLPPTVGTWLRLLFRPAPSWLQFLPSVVGLLGLVVWLWKRRGPWSWRSVTGPLLLASSLTTSYGWTFDQIILLPVVVDLISRLRWVSRRRRFAVLGALALFQVALLLQNHYHIGDEYSVWHGFGLAALYFWVAANQRGAERTTSLEANSHRDTILDSNRGYRRWGQRLRP
ncbi:glycosyltransferase family 87 protein [Chloroflexota bacterium]